MLMMLLKTVYSVHKTPDSVSHQPFTQTLVLKSVKASLCKDLS